MCWRRYGSLNVAGVGAPGGPQPEGPGVSVVGGWRVTTGGGGGGGVVPEEELFVITTVD